MNNYNEFYLHIEDKISELNKQITKAENTLSGNICCQQIQKILADKDVVINKAFQDLNIPLHLQEQFKDELFTDDEFDHLCQVA
jgi:hypothetical protein